MVYNTLAIRNVALLYVTPEFFTDRNSWSYEWDDEYFKLNVSTHTFVTQMQDSLLEGQYLNRTRFENLTGEECFKRYSSDFITGGSVFAVPTPAWSSSSRNDSYLGFQVDTGGLMRKNTSNVSRDASIFQTSNLQLARVSCEASGLQHRAKFA